MRDAERPAGPDRHQLAATGGRTSHAAVFARQLAKVCLVGCGDLEVDLATRTCAISGRRFAEGDALTLDGESGQVYAGMIHVVSGAPTDDLAAVEHLRAIAGG